MLVLSEDVAKCLDIVPSMFFRPNFDLTDPAVFEEVMSMQASTSLQEEVRLLWSNTEAAFFV